MALNQRVTAVEISQRKSQVATFELSGTTWHVLEYHADGPGFEEGDKLQPFLSGHLPKTVVNGNRVSLSLSIPSIRVRFLMLPPMAEGEIPQAMKWELQSVLGDRPEDYVIRSWKIPEVPGKSLRHAYLAATILRKDLEAMQTLISRLQMPVTFMTFPPLLFQSFFARTAGTMAHLYVGEVSTFFSIWKGEHLVFTREFRREEASVEEWERLLQQEIPRSLSFYQEEFQETVNPTIWVTDLRSGQGGGWDPLENYPQFPTASLEIPENLVIDSKQSFKELVCLVGTAWGAPHPLAFSLGRGWGKVERLRLPVRGRPMVLAIGLAALLIFLPVGMKIGQVAHQKKLTAKVAEWQVALAEREREELIRQALEHRRIPDQPLMLFFQTLPAGVVLERVSFDSKTKKLEVQAEADSLQSVSQLVQRVEESEAWISVKVSELQNVNGRQHFRWEGMWQRP